MDGDTDFNRLLLLRASLRGFIPKRHQSFCSVEFVLSVLIPSGPTLSFFHV